MKTTINMHVKSVLATMTCLLLLGVTSAYAAVSGSCANCHTMHNSQGGVSEIDEGPSGSLTKGTCVGCHTGNNTVNGVMPYVFSPDGPTYGTDTLAGGNFYWVTQDGKKGHNVKGIPTMLEDGILNKAPGGIATCSETTGCHDSLFDIPTKATGCEGCHLAPKHHAARQVEGMPAKQEHGYFRFLSGHVGDLIGSHGVEGIEDIDWQHSKSETDHNEYLGVVSNNSTGGFAGVGGNTMTAYCTGCHGNFHVQQNTMGSWIRHPSDAKLPSDGEYTAYTVYDPEVPVARDAFNGVESTVDSDDMVMCLSCHRAHGSPYDDMLRWDYDTMIISGGSNDGTGCFKCHSEK